MNEVITIGVDLAKNVFQVHGVDAEGSVVVRRQLRRGQMLAFFKKQPPCLVGMEACATSHHWGREIEALGHQVRLMPPRYVKPYLRMLLVVGALSVIRRVKQAGYTRRPWLAELLQRRSTKIAAIALATRTHARPGR